MYILICLSLLLGALPVESAIHRVAKNGDGVEVFNDIQTVINSAIAGDTIIVSGDMGAWMVESEILVDQQLVIIGQG